MDCKEAYIKKQMNGLKDPTLIDFQMLSTAPIMQDKYKEEHITKEYILSYIEGAKILAQKCIAGKNPPVKFIILHYSLSIPCLFLCRQAIELKIKECLDKRKTDYRAIHDLNSLWIAFEDSLVNEQMTEEDGIISEMKRFINLLSELDNENATKLRYPKRKDGKISQERVTFVCLYKIVDTAVLFIKQLDEMMFID